MPGPGSCPCRHKTRGSPGFNTISIVVAFIVRMIPPGVFFAVFPTFSYFFCRHTYPNSCYPFDLWSTIDKKNRRFRRPGQITSNIFSPDLWDDPFILPYTRQMTPMLQLTGCFLYLSLKNHIKGSPRWLWGGESRLKRPLKKSFIKNRTPFHASLQKYPAWSPCAP